MGKCVYCKGSIEDERAVDVCDSCGRRVWGDKMFRAIKQNMGESKERGDLEQGSINAANVPKIGKR
jgi:uncharacterized UBP type Zn finger protein